MAAENPRHRQYGLTDGQVLDMYRYMVLARMLDERMWVLKMAGKINFAVSGQGQEGAQAGAGFALKPGYDYVLPYYRDLCLALIFGKTARSEMLSVYAKPEDPSSGGRQLPGHYGDKALRMITQSSPTGTQIPHAVGAALACKMRGEDSVTFVAFGEGSSNQGDFHEGLNFAGVHRLPVIFFCENNLYAISVPVHKQMACENVADRAIGYGFEGVVVDGQDPLEVYRVMKAAVEKGRQGGGPTLVEAKTYRFLPHSGDDNDRLYRPAEEVEKARSQDPILRLRQYLMDQGLLSESADSDLKTTIQAEVNEATVYAEKSPDAHPGLLERYVYSEEVESRD